MLKQAKTRNYACLGTQLVGGVIASLIVFQVVAATPIPNDLLRVQDDPITIRKASDADVAAADVGKASLALSGQSSGPSRKSGKLWTAQFFNQPDFPDGPPFGMIDHLGPPSAGPGPGPAEGMPSKFGPRTACLEAINWQMGAYGYRKSKLLLTDDQKPAWKAVEDAVDAFTQNMRAICGTLPNHYVGSPGIVERSDFLERQLSARLDFLRALKAPLEHLLGQLTPDQRASFDAPPPFPPF
ncbi:Spy/CpxP family protein refolding chaperone [Bradyrhizobium australiense]|uniref:Spy/CpxP family protein refolding chaperone n=1 Tax=Bradyrhizobium australiense TaxID=2721161 RepID=A0A7Y4GNY6_9BRAD|nr:Spy/CpxP family protein refolding chaperone [Bradyrhizobium australiense]NOJ39094.1 Spy/CpxP family protein refolding chaperone [Bradyrhizobium australiense]